MNNNNYIYLKYYTFYIVYTSIHSFVRLFVCSFMPLTRSQNLQLKQLQQLQESQPHVNTNIHKNNKHNYSIDFIDASIEWRKNKIKRDNCTFEYIIPRQ
jgi:hypothetical protein